MVPQSIQLGIRDVNSNSSNGILLTLSLKKLSRLFVELIQSLKRDCKVLLLGFSIEIRSSKYLGQTNGFIETADISQPEH